MTTCCHDHPPEDRLTRNQKLVLDALRDDGGPLTAYNLLDRLRDHGLRAPPQIYRALDKLVETGIVHRLESRNAFVSCNHAHCGGDGLLFAICNHCGAVEELEAPDITPALEAASAPIGFRPSVLIGEVRGVCSACHESSIRSAG